MKVRVSQKRRALSTKLSFSSGFEETKDAGKAQGLLVFTE